MKNNCHVHTAPRDTDQLSLTGEKTDDPISIRIFSWVKTNSNQSQQGQHTDPTNSNRLVCWHFSVLCELACRERLRTSRPPVFFPLRDLWKSEAVDHSTLRWVSLSRLRPRVPHSLPPREADPIFFSCADQRPSVAASDMVSFGGSKDEIPDDSLSLAASDVEELSGSIYALQLARVAPDLRQLPSLPRLHHRLPS